MTVTINVVLFWAICFFAGIGIADFIRIIRK